MIEIDYDELDKLLANRGISRRQLAAMIGISPQTLAGSFRRKGRIKIYLVWKIADCLGIKAFQLLKKDSDGNCDYDDWERIHFGRTEYDVMVEDNTIRSIGEKLVLLNEAGINQALKLVSLLTEVPRYQKTEAELTADKERTEQKVIDEFIRKKNHSDSNPTDSHDEETSPL